MSRRIGVLGGTFDPPHNGHVAMAVQLKDALRLDLVLLVVANRPWQKVGSRPIAPAEDRLELVQAAVWGVEGVEASRLEIDHGGSSYTADTLDELHRADPAAELWLLLGADAGAGLPTWKRGAEVRRHAHIAVAAREGELDPPPPGWDWQVVPFTRLDISSTEVRRMVEEGRRIDGLVPPRVRSRIDALRLYRSRQ